MRRLLALLSAIMLFCPTALAAEGPISGDRIKDGNYKIEVSSSSSMFRVTDCVLTVSDGKMFALMTLSGTGYEKLFMGSGEDAVSAGEDEFIYFYEDAEGKYNYAVPVAALNAEIECAAFSIRKQTWYDRTLVFEADSLPKKAFKGNLAVPAAVAAAVIVLIALAAALVFVRKRRGK